jgi:pyruvate/2-oxoglutarate dehydrogenase complex dihydrolipoamide acyltransferase (E2) component
MGSHFTEFKNLSSWRRISLNAWKYPTDPTVYGTLDFNMERAVEYLDGLRTPGGPRITATHLIALALARALRQHPKCNGLIARGRIYLRDTVDIFVQVVSEGGDELSGIKIERADEKSVLEIAHEVAEHADQLRHGRDQDVERTKQLVNMMPGSLLGMFMRFIEFLNYDVGLDLTRFGVVRDGFGSAMVSNIGTFGLTFGLGPLVPMTRTPIVILVGEIRDRPWVVDGQLAVRPAITLGCTFDHRFIDGAHAGKLVKVIRAILEDPAHHLGAEVEAAPASSVVSVTSIAGTTRH